MTADDDVLGNCSCIAQPLASLQSKALLLQSWYDLSGPGLEKQLARDLMFRRFINLGLGEACPERSRRGVPDHSTVWRFCITLTKQGLLDTLLLEVNRQLLAKALSIKTGEVSIVDAAVTCAPEGTKPMSAPDMTSSWTNATPATASCIYALWV